MNNWSLASGKFRLSLKMESDWHVGAGVGRPGDIDRLLRRDPSDELPYIPAKTLTGVWRDACERIAWGLDNQAKGSWSKWVDYLFGEQPALFDRAREDGDASDPADLEKPRRAMLTLRPAYLPDELRQLLPKKPAAREAIAFTKPGIAIHPRTGQARANFLRFEEMARLGALLTSEGEITFPPDITSEQCEVATALLLAGAQGMERLGGKRRRGAGKCRCLVNEQEIKNHPHLLRWFEQTPPPPPTAVEDNQSQNIAMPTRQQPAPPEWVEVELTLEPEFPLIIPAHTVGNLIESQDYIPGFYLLPIISRKLRAVGVDVHTALQHNAIVITNATMKINHDPSRPVPLCIAQEKNGGLGQGRVRNRFKEDKPPHEPIKSHKPGYVGAFDASSKNLPVYGKPDLRVETHNVVKDEVQRPNADVGGVYSYQAIAPLREVPETKEIEPTAFQAMLRLRADFAPRSQTSWAEVLNGECRIGRSAKDDYGLIKITAHKRQPKPVTTTIGNDLTVWLLSDILLRDERLRLSASLEILGATLSRELGLSLKPVKFSPGGKHITAAAKQRRTDSWHTKWGLPRPTLAGLQAGSCVKFEIEEGAEALLSEHLSRLEQTGIGERRAEGFGQISFNDPLVIEPLHGLPPASKKATNQFPTYLSLISPDGAYEYARLIERAAILTAVKRSVLGKAADAYWRNDALGISPKQPTMSQLGGFRAVVSSLKPNDAQTKQAVLDWLNRISESRNRIRAWPQEPVNRLRDLIQKEERVWELLAIDFPSLMLTTSEQDVAKEATKERQQELWAEAVRTLVDACLRAHKRDLEKEAKNA